MYFRVNLKIEKANIMLFNMDSIYWTYFQKTKTWDGQFFVTVGEWGILRNGRGPSNGIGGGQFYFEESFRAFPTVELPCDISTKFSTFFLFAF